MRKSRTVVWMGMAFAVAIALTLVVFLATPPGHRVGQALRATARWSYLWFWPAYAGGALAALFGSRFQPIARCARDFGLAFASAHLVHVGLVALLLYVSTTPFPRGPLIFFGVGVFFVYLLALLSIRAVAESIAAPTVRLIRIVGVEYIALAFLYDFAKNPFHGGIRQLLGYLPFLVLAVGGALLKVAAAVKRMSRHARRLDA